MELPSYTFSPGQATELFSLGKDMEQQGIPDFSCGVPCVESNGILVPLLGVDPKNYDRPRFGLSVASYDETGGGVVTLKPEDESALIALPVLNPEAMDPKVLANILRKRAGFVALHASFDTGFVMDDATGREIITSTVAMSGETADRLNHPLLYSGDATQHLLNLFEGIGTGKLKDHIAEKAKARLAA